mmetsp:Transcript_41306/g.97084  ORF Transcript_41306/g.97084 Transcript_41306/m.97084 type:complete len:244 (+) Transcript_41306:349-1080(+)
MSSFGASRGLSLKITTPDTDMNFIGDADGFDHFGDVYGPARENCDLEPEEVVLSPRSELRMDNLLGSTIDRCLWDDLARCRGLYFSCEIEVEEEEDAEAGSETSAACGKRKRTFDAACEAGYESPEDASPTSVVWHDWKKVDKEAEGGNENLEHEIGVAGHSTDLKQDMEAEDCSRPSKRAAVEDGAAKEGVEGKDWISGLCANALRERERESTAPVEAEDGSEQSDEGQRRLEAEVRVACTA